MGQSLANELERDFEKDSKQGEPGKAGLPVGKCLPATWG